MPIYEYRCTKGHVFEVMQRMSDDPVTTCETCGAPVERVFHPIAVHFKGKGFYNTDYGTKNRQREKESSKGERKTDGAASGGDSGSSSSSSGEGSGSSGSSGSEGGKSETKKAETKKDAKPASSSTGS